MNRPLIFSTRVLISVIVFASFGLIAVGDAKDSRSLPFKGLITHFIGKFEVCGQSAREISFNPKLSKLINKTSQRDAGLPDVIRLIETRVDNMTNDKYFIDFDDGPSCDPGFTIVPYGQEKPVARIGADHIIIPGNGFLYSIARSNELFTVRRKYVLKGRILVEVPQPVLAVDLESKALRNLKIYSKKDGGEVVATIPKDEKLTVLINDGEYFLLKTRFGLVGWAKFGTASEDAQAIEGIFFDGD